MPFYAIVRSQDKLLLKKVQIYNDPNSQKIVPRTLLWSTLEITLKLLDYFRSQLTNTALTTVMY
jgi:hypothetical protein